MQAMPTLDRMMERILFVSPQVDEPVSDTPDENARSAQNALSFSLLFSGVRCVLQYAVLPFILPIIGIAADAAIPLLLIINVAAIVSIVFSLRRFWRIRYAHRWTYLVVATVGLTLLTVFLWMDVQALHTLGAA
jgi:uncharacterized membrane protein